MKFILLLLLGTTFLFSAVDLNTANMKELIALKAVGEKKATRIIEYRKTKCLESVQELKKIKHIKGKKILKKNKGNLTVSSCSR